MLFKHTGTYLKTVAKEALLAPFVMTAALAVTVWIVTMELIIAHFLSEETNAKRNWELTYWYE